MLAPLVLLLLLQLPQGDESVKERFPLREEQVR